MTRLLLFSLGVILLLGLIGHLMGLMAMAARMAFCVWAVAFVIHVAHEWRKP